VRPGVNCHHFFYFPRVYTYFSDFAGGAISYQQIAPAKEVAAVTTGSTYRSPEHVPFSVQGEPSPSSLGLLWRPTVGGLSQMTCSNVVSLRGRWVRARHHHQRLLWGCWGQAGGTPSVHPLQVFGERCCVSVPCYSQCMGIFGIAQKMQSSCAGKKQVLHQDPETKATHTFSGKAQK